MKKKDLKEELRRLKKENELFRGAEKMIGVGSYELRLDTKQLVFSEGMYHLFGEEPHSFKPDARWVASRSHPDDTDIINEIFRNAVRDKEPYFYRRRIYDSSGEMKTLECHGKVICNSDGEAVKLRGLVKDITSEQKAEKERALAHAQLRDQLYFTEQVTHLSPDIIFVLDINTFGLNYTNNTFAALMGYTPEETSAMKHSILDIIHPEDRARMIRHIRNMKTAADGEVRQISYRTLDKAGKVHWFNDRNVVFSRDEKGAPVEKLGFAHDITGRRKAEEQLLSMELSKQKEVLNAIIMTQEQERARIGEALHNGVAQLLYGIQTRLQLLSPSEENKEKIKELLDLTAESINDARKISFELVPVALKEHGIEVALKTLFRRVIESELNLTLSIAGLKIRLPEHIEYSVYRIVQELVNNILRHSKATKASIKIRRVKNYLNIIVLDNGIGFTPPEPGSAKGIGLESIKNRVTLLNGTFTIKRAEPAGTEVCILMDWKKI